MFNTTPKFKENSSGNSSLGNDDGNHLEILKAVIPILVPFLFGIVILISLIGNMWPC